VNIEYVPADTTREAAWVQLEAIRRMPPGRRLELACRLSDDLRRVVAAGVRGRHPGMTEDQVKLAVARLTLGEELFRRVYPGIKVQV
jgi:hypothetical protein